MHHDTAIIGHLAAALPANTTFTLVATSVHGTLVSVTLMQGDPEDFEEITPTAHQRLVVAQAAQRLAPGTPFARAFSNIPLLCAPITSNREPARPRGTLPCTKGSTTTITITFEHDGKGNLLDFYLGHHVNLRIDERYHQPLQTMTYIDMRCPIATYDALFARFSAMRGPFYAWEDASSYEHRYVIAPDNEADRNLLDNLAQSPGTTVLGLSDPHAPIQERAFKRYP